MARVILPIAALVAVGAVLVGGFVAISKLQRHAQPDPAASIEQTWSKFRSEARPSNIRSDERVVFFPTVARLSEDGSRWIIPVYAWVFEPEEDALVRGAAIDALARSIGLDDDADANAVFRERAAWFLVDNERSKRLTIRVAIRAVELDGTTSSEGHLRTSFEMPATAGGMLRFSAMLPHGDDRQFAGVAQLLEPTGVTVISDIDDTVKVSHVTDRKKLLRKTFLEPFEAAPGMAQLYQKLSVDHQGAAFIYVSSSPWQLYPALSKGLEDAGFPRPAAFHLKTFRAKDSRMLDLLADPLEAKVARIEAIIADHPQRDYLLIGDTGERDPEVYAAIAESHPDRIRRVMLRNVTGESLDNERLSALYEDLGVPVELINPE